MSNAKEYLVNDIHSKLNATIVSQIIPVDSIETLQTAVALAQQQSKAISIMGRGHAMGGQQFGSDTLLLDMTHLNRILDFDQSRGLIKVESGVQWPQLIDYLISRQKDRPWSQQWAIAQKQTGADDLSLGGCLAANIHGRGLQMSPLIADVESFVLVDAQGQYRLCNRQENSDLFRLAIGGYGLFGVIYSVTLRLIPRQKVERRVELLQLEQLMSAFAQRIEAGYMYGDFQFATDESSTDFLRRGVFSCYRPVDPATPIPSDQNELSPTDWQHLYYLSHADKSRAFDLYAAHYLATNGKIYGSDTHQLSTYLTDYHQTLDRQLGASHPATEVITELYVPRAALVDFMSETRIDFRGHQVNLIYGTIRLIEPDTESFLAWARQPYACIIFNLHTDHTQSGLAHTAAACQRLIDLAIGHGGSYYLTYHKYATRRQVEACYPQFPEFLRGKLAHDPAERFQSNWYRHYKEMFAEVF